MADDKHITDQAARQILARAAEIDRHQSQLSSIETVRAAAEEAGIAPAAFDAAVREYHETAPPTEAISRRRVVAGVVGVTLAALLGLTYLVGREPRDVDAMPARDTPITRSTP